MNSSVQPLRLGASQDRYWRSVGLTDNFGLYHTTAEEKLHMSINLQAKYLNLQLSSKTTVVVAAPNEFPSKVPRPKYSVLENNALKVLGLNSFRTWEEGLRSYLNFGHHTN